MKVLLDADALIKLTKAGAKELIVTAFEVFVPEAVIVEVVKEGKAAGRADAAVVDENVRLGKIKRATAHQKHQAAELLQAPGDRAVLNLSLEGGHSAVVTDDAALLHRLKAHGISATVPAGLLLAAGRRRRLPASELQSLLESLRPYISSEEYVTYRLTLEGRYPRK
jgi:rRNA-processing protein FCF1